MIEEDGRHKIRKPLHKIKSNLRYARMEFLLLYCSSLYYDSEFGGVHDIKNTQNVESSYVLGIFPTFGCQGPFVFHKMEVSTLLPGDWWMSSPNILGHEEPLGIQCRT